MVKEINDVDWTLQDSQDIHRTNLAASSSRQDDNHSRIRACQITIFQMSALEGVWSLPCSEYTRLPLHPALPSMSQATRIWLLRCSRSRLHVAFPPGVWGDAQPPFHNAAATFLLPSYTSISQVVRKWKITLEQRTSRPVVDLFGCIYLENI